MEVLLQKLNELIKSKGITQAELAEKTGKNRSSLNMILSGKLRLDMETFLKICEVLEVSPAYFFETENKNDEILDGFFKAFKDYTQIKYFENVLVNNVNKFLSFDYWFFVWASLFNLSTLTTTEVSLGLYFINFEMNKLADLLNQEKLPEKFEKAKKILASYITFTYKIIEALEKDDKSKLKELLQKFVKTVEDYKKQVQNLYLQKYFPKEVHNKVKKFMDKDDVSIEDLQGLLNISTEDLKKLQKKSKN